MPRGGRRPGAGAPKGNFNGLKNGGYSPRMRFALAAMLSVPEYRHIVRFLHQTGDQAHREFVDLTLAATRIMYDRPLNDEIHALLDQAAATYINRVGPVVARRAMAHYQRRLGVDDLMPKRRRLPRHKVSATNPIHRELAALLLGPDPDLIAQAEATANDYLRHANDPEPRHNTPLSATGRGAGGEGAADAKRSPTMNTQPRDESPPLRSSERGSGGEVTPPLRSSERGPGGEVS